ncbi:MAG: aromatic amino acid transport family protein [Patescibacteria group bacterium]
MVKEFFKNYVYPIATMSGSIIGVGFLSLPYIASRVGIWPMLFYFVILTAIVVLIHVILGEISLRTPDFKRWPGFVGFYFGNWAKRIIVIPMILGSFGVLLAYLIVGSQFLNAIFSQIIEGDLLFYVFSYFIILSLAVYFGVKAISRLEFWAIVLLLISILLIFIKGFFHINLNNILIVNWELGIGNFLLPYGAILFSLWGTALIPEAEEMIRGRKQSLKKIIIVATLIPAIIYLLFIFLVLGITGSQTTESALVGVKNVLGNGISSIILFVGVITTFTAFIAHGLFLKKMFIYDLGIKEKFAWVLVCFTPLILYLLGFNSFITIVSFIGGVLLGVDGILILLMYQKIGGSHSSHKASAWRRNIIIYPLMLVFILGIIYSLIYFIK